MRRLNTILKMTKICLLYSYHCEPHSASRSSQSCPSTYYRSDDCCYEDKQESAVCGKQLPEQHSRIFGGRRSTYKKWPWLVYIQNRKSTSCETCGACGGTFINPEWILTAGHCVIDPDPTTWKVLLGVTDFRVENGRLLTDDPYSEYQVLDVIIHQNYSKKGAYRNALNNRRTYSTDDVALLRVKRVTGKILPVPICLPHGEKPTVAQNCYVGGYGAAKWRGRPTFKIKEGLVPIAANTDCLRSYQGINMEQLICAGTGDGKVDACQADSGGPLICQRCESCSFYLAGVVSFGEKCGKTYGVYSRVSYYQNWIDEVTQGAITPVDTIKPCPISGRCDDSCKSIKFESYHFFDTGKVTENDHKIYRDSTKKMYLIPVIDSTFTGWVIHSKKTFSWETSEDYKYVTKLGSRSRLKCPDSPTYKVYANGENNAAERLNSKIVCSDVESPPMPINQRRTEEVSARSPVCSIAPNPSVDPNSCCTELIIQNHGIYGLQDPYKVERDGSDNRYKAKGFDQITIMIKQGYIVLGRNYAFVAEKIFCYVEGVTEKCIHNSKATYTCNHFGSWKLNKDMIVKCASSTNLGGQGKLKIRNHKLRHLPDPIDLGMDRSMSNGLTPFFNWIQTSVRLCGSGSQKF